MIGKISDDIPNINECILELINKHNFIKDTDEGLSFVNDKEENHLHIEKVDNTEVFLIKNDNCVMINVNGGQCDLLILNDIKLFFIEIKGSHENKSNHRRQAYKQLENTYKYYKKFVDFNNEISLFAMICFKSKKRIIQSSASTKKKEFKIKYNINLIEGNYILFD